MADARPSNGRLVPAPGEELGVAFANTRYWRGGDAVEELNGLGDVLAWCEGAGSIDGRAVAEVDAWARQHGDDAARLFDEVIAARETVYAALSATAAGKAVAARDLDAFNALLAAAPARTRLAAGPDGKNRWRLPAASPTTASLLAPALWSAGDLLAGQRLQRLRLCANPKCCWLFVDDSKSGTRRWCTMRACGNRAKAHRHYLRKTHRAADLAG